MPHLISFVALLTMCVPGLLSGCKGEICAVTRAGRKMLGGMEVPNLNKALFHWTHGCGGGGIVMHGYRNANEHAPSRPIAELRAVKCECNSGVFACLCQMEALAIVDETGQVP